MSTDEQSQMVDDISSIIMRGRYGRSGVGRPSDNPLDLRDARRIVEYVMARDARVRRDAAREAIDELIASTTHVAALLRAENGGNVEDVLAHYRDACHPKEDA